MRSILATACAGLCAVLPADAQTVEAIDIRANLLSTGSRVHIHATIVARPEGAQTLPLTLLLHPDEHLLAAVALVDGDRVSLDFTSERPPLYRAEAPLPGTEDPATSLAEARTPETAAPELITIRLEIVIDHAIQHGDGTLDAHIPIPIPTWPPASGAEDRFRATVETTATGTLVRAFPSNLTLERSHQGSGARRFITALPVPPAFLRLSLSQRPSWLRIERLADGLAILLLLTALAWALVRLRQAQGGTEG